MEGYIVIAANNSEYLEFALNLSLSIKLNDGTRPVALLHDGSIKIPAAYKAFFNETIEIGRDDAYFGSANKLLLYKYSPFTKSMYVDSDCLMAKRDISVIWKKLGGYNFTVVGQKIFEGQCENMDVAKLRNSLHLPYMVKHNAGVLYFDKSDISMRAFELMSYYINKHRADFFVGFRGAFADQPLIAAAMGALKLEPFPYAFRSPFRRRQWMHFLFAKCIEVDIDVLKGRGMYRFGMGNGVLQNPTILHFVGYRQPADIYLRESNKLRQKFNVPMLSMDVVERR